MLIKDILDRIELTPDEHSHFVKTCSNWGHYCEAISNMDKVTIMKLIKYLKDERPSSKNLLTRAISRFNRLNALKKEALDEPKTTTIRTEGEAH